MPKDRVFMGAARFGSPPRSCFQIGLVSAMLPTRQKPSPGWHPPPAEYSRPWGWPIRFLPGVAAQADHARTTPTTCPRGTTSDRATRRATQGIRCRSGVGAGGVVRQRVDRAPRRRPHDIGHVRMIGRRAASGNGRQDHVAGAVAYQPHLGKASISRRLRVGSVFSAPPHEVATGVVRLEATAIDGGQRRVFFEDLCFGGCDNRLIQQTVRGVFFGSRSAAFCSVVYCETCCSSMVAQRSGQSDETAVGSSAGPARQSLDPGRRSADRPRAECRGVGSRRARDRIE